MVSGVMAIQEYIPVILQILIALGIAVGAIVISLVLGKRGSKNKAKASAYECGKEELGPSGARFSVKFYLVAMIFILFDIEIIFMYPWALSFGEMIQTAKTVLWAMFIFVAIIEVGHYYAYKKKVFDWNSR